MRLRNIPRSENVLNGCKEVVKNETSYRGTWQSVFENNNPIHMEIGMGKGQFLLSLSSLNPQINYVGIERYSSVLLRAVEKLHQPGDPIQTPMPNIRFLCMDARDILQVFAPGEISRIYLNFSDPWPKAKHARRRLTSMEFLERYRHILIPGGTIEFKTDNVPLFDFSMEQLRKSSDFEISAYTYHLHQDARMNQGNIMTEYEEKFSSMGNPICKLIAKRKFPS